MRRIDLPELEDQAWFPAWLRNAMTGYLQVVIEQARPYDVALPALEELLAHTGCDQIVDLASGAGGPWRQLAPGLRSSGLLQTVRLTDIQPNRAAIASYAQEPGIDYRDQPVSALEVPAALTGVRTMFTSLHHFDAEEVRSILTSAQRARVGFAAFEAAHRSWRGLFVALFIPLLVLLLMPRVQPRRIAPLLLTYLPPLLPLLIWWDGLASTLRTHSAEELRALTADISEPGYSWRVDEIPVRGVPIPVLQVVGRPE